MTPLHESLNRFRSLAGLKEAQFDPSTLAHIETEQDLRRQFGDHSQIYLVVFTAEGPEDSLDTISNAFHEYDMPANADLGFHGVITPQNAAQVIHQVNTTEFADPEAIMSNHVTQGAMWMFSDNGATQMALFTFTQPGLTDDGDADPDGDVDFWLMVPLQA